MIGAGAAGLVAARELIREGHHVTVFEMGSGTGGVWVYTDEVEAPDLLGEPSIGYTPCSSDTHTIHSELSCCLRKLRSAKRPYAKLSMAKLSLLWCPLFKDNVKCSGVHYSRII